MTSEQLNGAISPRTIDADLDESDERNDFTQDELLRHLPLEQWFATADQSIPLWWH
jgi:hypothetical protein